MPPDGSGKPSGRELTQYKPGQSGNPAGPGKSPKRKLTTMFLADIHEAWSLFGKPALVAAAWTDPVGFVRIVASLMPKEIHATLELKNAQAMSDDQLADVVASDGGLDIAAPPEGEEVLQPVGSAFRH